MSTAVAGLPVDVTAISVSAEQAGIVVLLLVGVPILIWIVRGLTGR